MTTLGETLTTRQEDRLESGRVRLTVDMSPIYPGCFIARDLRGNSAAGRSPRLAIEALERK